MQFVADKFLKFENRSQLILATQGPDAFLWVRDLLLSFKKTRIFNIIEVNHPENSKSMLHHIVAEIVVQ